MITLILVLPIAAVVCQVLLAGPAGLAARLGFRGARTGTGLDGPSEAACASEAAGA